jgi:hypothetical protein
MNGFCIKCQVIREIKDPKPVTIPLHGAAVKGTCPVCGTVIYAKVQSP